MEPVEQVETKYTKVVVMVSDSGPAVFTVSELGAGEIVQGMLSGAPFALSSMHVELTDGAELLIINPDKVYLIEVRKADAPVQQKPKLVQAKHMPIILPPGNA